MNQDAVHTILQQNGFGSFDEIARARRQNLNSETGRPEDNRDLPAMGDRQHEGDQAPIGLQSVLVSRPLDGHESQGHESILSPTRNRFVPSNRTP
ncbi:hypothetical protein CHU98_g776 [Xylaria longipes]|nr:hypothetical protein CHU98_g776 [Xylaria longipes]